MTPVVNRRPYKARYVANSSSRTTTELSKLLTSCLTAVKSRVIRYYEIMNEMSRKNIFSYIKISGEVLSKLKSSGCRSTSLPTYDFSTLYTTLTHILIKEKLLNLIEPAFKRSSKMNVRFILPATIRKHFPLLQTIAGINFGLARMYMTPYRIFWIIFTSELVISYTDKLLVFRWVQIVLLL